MTMTDKRRHERHRFGGDWTTKKLDVVAKYLHGYTTALKRTPFEKVYIDAFAGTGYRDGQQADAETAPALELLPDFADREAQGLLEGSAKRALRVGPPFDRYVFIERSEKRCQQLETFEGGIPRPRPSHRHQAG
jgi:three-Cys-motif partner protein